MARPFEAIRLTERVYWVGAVDWSLRDFHGYSTNRGTTYNAYLVLADRVALIDTVKAPFRDELLTRISSVIDPADIAVIVSNHSEMDHSGSLPDVVDRVKPDEVVASTMGVEALRSHFGGDLAVRPVKDGDVLDLGDASLSFIETRMLHWPDSMFSYLPLEELLFSQDAFGMHLASREMFADMLDAEILQQEASKYYANILLPYSSIVTELLARVRELGLAIRTVAPDHGPIWRRDISTVLGWYERWAGQAPTTKVVVVYDTMWGSTAALARAAAEGVELGGGHPRVLPARATHRSDVATEILDAGGLLVGSPTINNGIFPSLADVLSYLRGLKPKNLVGAAFGSYGWSGEAVGQVEAYLREMGVELVGTGVKVRYVPVDDDLNRCRELGRLTAEKLVGRA